ncbi:MAG: NAD-dependent DNA ligase LigA [Chitinophagales bacterium]|nr:NAD-dependent DNA ligase LigA [Chitinophagales bacterium]
MSIDKVKELETKIAEAQENYYNKQPMVSDEVYDSWIDELKDLDPENKLLSIVGFEPTSEWKKAKHKIPMGSLDKVNSKDEFIKWVTEISDKHNLLVTEKLDGISIEVIYEDGKFFQAITRGSGVEGEDITVNVKKMKGIKSKLKEPYSGSLRGEIILKKSDWKNHFPEYSNPRNAASGIAKRLDGVGCEHLTVFFYQEVSDNTLQTEEQVFSFLNNVELNVPNYKICSIDEVGTIWDEYQEFKREQLDYDIDGLVVKFNNIDFQLSLGEKNLRPKGAIAFKFASKMKETLIKDIKWQVGNSGRVTPVAVIEPVIIDAKIENASIYNIAYINKLGIDIGAKVLVSRRNDVIPRIEQVIESTGSIAKAPENCPSCNSKLFLDGENLHCINYDCQAQIIGRIKNWISGLNILEWGDTLVEKLVLSNKVKDISDLYKLSIGDLSSIDRMAEKSATKCFNIIWNNSIIDLEIFLGSLSFPLIGRSTIKMITSSGLDTLEKILNCNLEDLEKINGVGPIKARSLFDSLKVNKVLIDKIINNGVKIKEKTIGKFTGKRFVFTGKMENKRQDLEQIVIDNGGEVKSSISKDVNYLVIADPNSGSSKAIAARKNGTLCISEKEFLEMVK